MYPDIDRPDHFYRIVTPAETRNPEMPECTDDHCCDHCGMCLSTLCDGFDGHFAGCDRQARFTEGREA